MRQLLLAGAFCLIAGAAFAATAKTPAPAPDPRAGMWGPDPQSTSAELARSGWKFLSMATMSWTDGRQAIVTMWSSKLGDFARCFDYFDPAMHQIGGACERSGTGL